MGWRLRWRAERFECWSLLPLFGEDGAQSAGKPDALQVLRVVSGRLGKYEMNLQSAAKLNAFAQWEPNCNRGSLSSKPFRLAQLASFMSLNAFK